MRRVAAILGLVALVVCGSLGTGAPVKGRVFSPEETVPASGSKNYLNTFKAGERASVTVRLNACCSR